MQTSRHRIFTALAVCATACTPRPKQPPTPPQAEQTAPVEAEPEPAAAPPVKRRPLARKRPPSLGAPVIRVARISAPSIISLHFSEPVTAPENLDPNQFRLSLAQSYREAEDYDALYYYDPAGMEDPELSTSFMEVRVQDEMSIDLVLSRPLSQDACEEARDLAAEAAEDPNANGGIFLHYQDRYDAGIEDAEGNRLQDIAPQWVARRATSASYTGQNLPSIEALGPIPCGF